MMRSRGFTLLEVMVAMAILALGLTTILSSQTGLFATARRVQNETYAASLMRCKMSEVELEMLQNGYPLIDQSESGECCEDEDDSEFSCEWTIQTVELPQPGLQSDDAEAGADGLNDLVDGAEEGAQQQAPVNPLTGPVPGEVGGIDDLAGSLGQSASGGGMIGMALGLVYPALKPMLEASIRKVTVSVIWFEGRKERRFEVIQYLTNPLEGNLSPNAAADAAAGLGAGLGLPGAQPAPDKEDE